MAMEIGLESCLLQYVSRKRVGGEFGRISAENELMLGLVLSVLCGFQTGMSIEGAAASTFFKRHPVASVSTMTRICSTNEIH